MEWMFGTTDIPILLTIRAYQIQEVPHNIDLMDRGTTREYRLEFVEEKVIYS